MGLNPGGFGSGEPVAIGDGAFRGVEQFGTRAETGGVRYCIAEGRPYRLEFATDFDVICLLLGDIAGRSRFDDGREEDIVFQGETTAFHPRGGNVRVQADQVRHGFIAFGYSPEFEEIADDRAIDRLRLQGSRNNLNARGARQLARYVRERVRQQQGLEPLELQSLATLTFLDTLRSLDGSRPGGRARLSDAEFERIRAFVDAELANEISCASIAAAAGLPLRVVFDGMKARTGMTPYRFVVERRVARARELLQSTELPISDIAFACGFSSQQHLTSTLSARLGLTPLRLRRGE